MHVDACVYIYIYRYMYVCNLLKLLNFIIPKKVRRKYSSILVVGDATLL